MSNSSSTLDYIFGRMFSNILSYQYDVYQHLACKPVSTIWLSHSQMPCIFSDVLYGKHLV